MRYIIYCRKSSESEDRQVMPLDARERELSVIAQRDNLTVVKVLCESMSAKTPGRPVFAQMMEMIAKGQADNIKLTARAWQPFGHPYVIPFGINHKGGSGLGKLIKK